MMIKIKNVRPGTLIIPDADLTLKPGQEIECSKISPQMNAVLTSGHIVRIDEPKQENNNSLSVAEEEEEFETNLSAEKRRTVKDVLTKRFKEDKDGTN